MKKKNYGNLNSSNDSVNYALDLLHYRMYGKESYVYQDKDRYYNLLCSRIGANDKTTISSFFTEAIENEVCTPDEWLNLYNFNNSEINKYIKNNSFEDLIVNDDMINIILGEEDSYFINNIFLNDTLSNIYYTNDILKNFLNHALALYPGDNSNAISCKCAELLLKHPNVEFTSADNTLMSKINTLNNGTSLLSAPTLQSVDIASLSSGRFITTKPSFLVYLSNVDGTAGSDQYILVSRNYSLNHSNGEYRAYYNRPIYPNVFFSQLLIYSSFSTSSKMGVIKYIPINYTA